MIAFFHRRMDSLRGRKGPLQFVEPRLFWIGDRPPQSEGKTMNQIIRTYIFYGLIMSLYAAMSWMLGDSASLIFLKALGSGMYLLSQEGLRAHFPEQHDATRSLATWIEFKLLNAVLFGTVITFLNFRPDAPLDTTFRGFVVAAGVMAALDIGFLLYRRRRPERPS
ncbi:hypothetical protein [Ciceribacter sp. RN22]|uniref:hypothetical protein n=1 Tax=Ciceribacter sp. RN22 TaxID=2954932 RepID=UPI002091ECAA|nr:hypothetical protein [Ciceribacter sp. RN22]MCO6176950.1 hypothetical protein [Ciceribacter sp. RN22]